jgi:hypothetical protein
MPKLAVSRVLIFMTFLVALGAAPADSETWVSPTGDDDNVLCDQPDTACKSIGAAIEKTPVGGLVRVLPGGYTSVSINKAVDIIADSGQAAIFSGVGATCGSTGGFAAVCVSAPADAVVRIRGLIIEEHNTATIPIRFFSAAALHVEDVILLESNNRFGLEFVPSSGASELYISDSVISDSRTGTGAGGILIKPTGSASVKAVIENVLLENNYVGLLVDGTGNTGGSIKVNMADSVVSGNTAQGVLANSPANGAPVDVTIKNSTITGNGHAGVLAQAATPSGRGSVIVRFGGSTITHNAAGVLPYTQGVVRSLGGNFVDANGSGNGPFTIINPE